MNIKNNLKYYWWEFKAQFLGGYEMFKETFDIQQMKENFKHNMKVMKEEDEYERQQKMYNKKSLLKPNYIVEFYQENKSYNVIKGKVIDTYHSTNVRDIWTGEYPGREGIIVEIEILESGFRNIGETRYFYQQDIMNNLISLNKEGK